MGIRRPVSPAPRASAVGHGAVAALRWSWPGLDGAVGPAGRRAGAAGSWNLRSARRRRGAATGRAAPWPRRDRRTFGDATTLDRRVAEVRIVDPHHPLYGKCFPVSDRRSGRGPALIVIRLPDGRERAISRSATAVSSASDDLAAPASCQAHISVRTLLPLANHVRAVLASRHADLEGNGARDLNQTPAEPEGVADAAATPVAAASDRDTTPACAAGGTAGAASAHSVRAIRGGSSC